MISSARQSTRADSPLASREIPDTSAVQTKLECLAHWLGLERVAPPT